MQEFFAFSLSPRVLYKAGLVSEIHHEIQRISVRRALIITDSGVRDAGVLESVQAGIADPVEIVGVYDQVTSN